MEEEKEQKRNKIILIVAIAMSVGILSIVVRSVFIQQGCPIVSFGKLMEIGSMGFGIGFMSLLVTWFLMFHLFISLPKKLEERRDRKNGIVSYRNPTDWKMVFSGIGLAFGVIVAILLLSCLIGYAGWMLFC